LKEGLELLNLLQKHDDQIAEIEIVIQKIPVTIKSLEAERDSEKHIIEQVKVQREENVKKREQLEKNILLIKEKIQKYREQMNKSTTNKEYQGFITEIKYEEDRISEIEENIIQRMLEFDEIMDEIRKRESEFNDIAAEYNDKIKELNSHLDYNKSKVTQETENKAELIKKIPVNLFSVVETMFCGICNVKIRPQLLNEIISTDNLFICENCGRILFKQIENQKKTGS
jgi:predicted  nucleic acid-binding Zn-ribbon protein